METDGSGKNTDGSGTNRDIALFYQGRLQHMMQSLVDMADRCLVTADTGKGTNRQQKDKDQNDDTKSFAHHFMK